jgi:hypothetical protein
MTPDESEPGPLHTRRFRAAALFLTACLVTGALLLVLGRSDTATTTPALVPRPLPSPQPPMPATATGEIGDDSTGLVTHHPSTSDAEPSGAPSACEVPRGDQAVPMAGPPASWQIIAGRVAAPFSPVFGPAVISAQGVGGCFAHSPTGALFALFQSLALSAAPADRVSQVAVVSERGSRTNMFAAALQEARQEDVTAATRMPSDPSTLPRQTLLGFHFIDYVDTRATIAVAVGIGDPSNTSEYQPSMVTGVMAWEDDDWKFVYSAQTAGSMAPIISAAQYVPWRA